MKTSRIDIMFSSLAGWGGFVALLGLCGVIGATISENSEGVAIGWACTALGVASSALGSIARQRHR
jgi:hypothetical protein